MIYEPNPSISQEASRQKKESFSIKDKLLQYLHRKEPRDGATTVPENSTKIDIGAIVDIKVAIALFKKEDYRPFRDQLLEKIKTLGKSVSDTVGIEVTLNQLHSLRSDSEGKIPNNTVQNTVKGEIRTILQQKGLSDQFLDTYTNEAIAIYEKTLVTLSNEQAQYGNLTNGIDSEINRLGEQYTSILATEYSHQFESSSYAHSDGSDASFNSLRNSRDAMRKDIEAKITSVGFTGSLIDQFATKAIAKIIEKRSEMKKDS